MPNRVSFANRSGTQSRMTRLLYQYRPVGRMRPPCLMRSRILVQFLVQPLALILVLSACGGQSDPGAAAVSPTIPPGNLLAAELVRSARPEGGAGECWAEELTPAVIETVTEQIEVAPAVPASAGKPAVPATFQSRVQQRILSDRSDVWFLVPCPEQMGPDTIASLQRALKVRGLFRGTVNGEMDAATAAAVRRYQAPQGLDSPKLSLAAARQLGLVAYARKG
jgi:Putative peptidoglycan binding domain